jgi:prepilin peptidase CpaA
MMNAEFTLTLLALLAATLLWIAVVDVKTRTISNWVNLAIALVAPVYWLSAGVPLLPDAGFRVAAGVAVFLLFAVAFYLNAMGGGDVKLAGALAIWFPIPETVKLIVVTSLAGGVLTLIVAGLHKARKKEGRPEVPYGVAIAFGGLWLLAQRFLNHFA